MIEVSVGPMRLTAFTPVKLDTIVAQSPNPRMDIHSFPSVTMVILPLNMKFAAMK